MQGVCIYDARYVHIRCEAENELFSAPQESKKRKVGGLLEVLNNLLEWI